MRRVRLAVIGIGALWCLLSCGLEEFYYIAHIPEVQYSETRSLVHLPERDADGYGGSNAYFDNFIIFYRIYISGGSPIPTGPHLQSSQQDRSNINASLNSDYVVLYSLTDLTSTTVNTANLENTFFNRRYFQMTLEGADITGILNTDSLGEILEFTFSPVSGEKPTLMLNETIYTLQRAADGQQGQFTPVPNRLFLNHPDLYSNANATTVDNADVAPNTLVEPRYTYISLYIAAVGRSRELPPKSIYSQPAFIGIFRLADSS